MSSFNNYYLIWFIYLVAAAAFYVFFWRITRFSRLRTLSYLLRAITLAVILTPWYVSTEQSFMAPAVMVMMMDALTKDASEVARAMVPLLLSITGAILLALVLSFNSKRRGNK